MYFLFFISCWEINENPVPNRLLNWPIMASVIVSKLMFYILILFYKCYVKLDNLYSVLYSSFHLQNIREYFLVT